MADRFAIETRCQVANASTAAVTAWSTSSAEASATWAVTSPVAGL